MNIRFDDFAFDSASRQLSRGGREVHLSLKAFELLRVLIERRPEAISKAALHEALWGGRFVSEANLPSLVNEVRAALGDAARTPRFLRTVHGFGYAFCGRAAEMTEVPPPAHQTGFVLICDDRRIRLSAGENIVGRDEDVAVSFDSPTVSRRHCSLRVEGSAVTVEDLGSKNGTYVRDARIRSTVPLADGERVRVGSFVLILRAVRRNVSTQTESAEKMSRRGRRR